MQASRRGAGLSPEESPAPTPLKNLTPHSKTTLDDREVAARALPFLSCPNPDCPEPKSPGGPNLRFRYRYGGQLLQLLFDCRTCHRKFSLRRDTPFFGLHTPEATVGHLTSQLGEGLGIRESARLLHTTPQTVLRILPRLGEHAQRVAASHLQDHRPGEVQLDELWSFLKKKEKNVKEVEALRQELGDCWVWVAFDPVGKVVLGFVIGKRTKENAIRLLRNVRARLGEGCLPLFTSDELACYQDALVEVYGTEVQPLRQGERGRFPLPVKVPPPGLIYAVVHKEREENRVVKVTREVRLGGEAAVARALAASPVSEKVNTSFIERQNGKLRADNGRLVRDTLGFSKEKEPFLHSLRVTMALEHFCRPHRGLRTRHAPGELPHGAVWEKRSPMMALGRTDHVWTVAEFLYHRVPAGTSGAPFGEMP